MKSPKPASPESIHPFLVGIRAAKANFLPGLVLQATMLAIVLAYFYHEPTRARLNVLAAWKQQGGYAFSAAISILAGAILPEIFQFLFFQKGKLKRQNFSNLLFTVPFWAFMGMSVDCLYRLQAIWFGTGTDFWTLVKKVAVDQFGYSAFYSAPISLLAYGWHRNGTGIKRLFTRNFWCRDLPPTVIANCGVWIPLVTIIYSLPPLLQIPLFGLALTFWVLILSFITSH